MKRFSKILAAMLALVLCVAMVTAASAAEINVVFIPKLSGNAFFESANVGAQEFAAKNGFTVTYDGNPEASAANQVAIVQNAITNGADAICISTVDAAA
jgi:AI-2 transport system substrate-binding protein